MGAFEQLLSVQTADTAADQLRHRLETLPERSALANAIAERDRIVATTEEVSAERHEVGRVQKRLEDEAATIEEKVNRDERQLYDGGITSPKDAEALQHELEALRGRLSEQEDLVLAQMEVADPLDRRLEELAEELASAEQQITVATAELEVAAQTVNTELSEVEAQRGEHIDGLDTELLADYEKLRGQLGGVAVARLAGDTCEGCHLQLSAVDFDVVKKAPVDEAVTCPECGRFLVR